MPVPPKRFGVLVAYIAMLIAAVGGYLLIRAAGADLVASAPAAGSVIRSEWIVTDPLAEVLLALALITLVARAMGVLFRRLLRQPPVIGEIFAGLALGPSLLGTVSPTLQAFVLPPDAAPFVGMIAKVGVVLFMFLVGLDLDMKAARKHGQATVIIAHASIITPFLLGALLALGLYPLYAAQDVDFTVFSLFIGVAMSVTAFPVLARILSDFKAQRTRLGGLALSSAAVGDATAKVSGVAWSFALSGAFVASMFWVARPLLRQLAAREERNPEPLSQGVLGLVFVALLLAGAATEFIGIHALFGAFLLGAVMQHDGRLAQQIRARMEDIVIVLLLPSFFAYTGMRTEVGLLSGATDWLACLTIIAVATAGKFGGSFIAGRFVGLSLRESSIIGILMNTRGLMELIVLNLGLEMGVISPRLFTMLVIMALVTTFATTPLLHLVMRKRGFADEPATVPMPTQERSL